MRVATEELFCYVVLLLLNWSWSWSWSQHFGRVSITGTLHVKYASTDGLGFLTDVTV